MVWHINTYSIPVENINFILRAHNRQLIVCLGIVAVAYCVICFFHGAGGEKTWKQ